MSGTILAGVSSGWEYTSVEADTWLPLSAQGAAKERLQELGSQGWEAFAVTPPTPPPGDGKDPDESVYEILLKRPNRQVETIAHAALRVRSSRWSHDPLVAA